MLSYCNMSPVSGVCGLLCLIRTSDGSVSIGKSPEVRHRTDY